MLDTDRKGLLAVSGLSFLCLATILIIDFLLRVGILTGPVTGLALADQMVMAAVHHSRNHLVFLRAGTILSMAGISFSRRVGIRRQEPGRTWILTGLFLGAALLFLVGYNRYLYYNLVVFPSTFIGLLWLVPQVVQSLTEIVSRVRRLRHPRIGRSSSAFTFVYPTDRGLLAIDDVRSATFIEGSAKAGKTASIILPTIVQAAEKGFAGLIYDYEGDLRETGSALLSRTAYGALRRAASGVNFGIINFTDLSRTMRCNPFSGQYISSYNHALEMALVVMMNINRQWSRQKDFWAENAIAAYAATIWFFHRNFLDKCTIPHITEFLLNDFRKVLHILSTDDDVAPYIRPILGALEREAAGQIAGAESSTQFPLARMRSPEVYYVFNPDPATDFSLDITDPERPVMLSICNAPELQHSLAPSIGAIIQVCKGQMNQLGKHRSIFLFDEMPTVYIDKADKIPAEARKKGVATFFAVQTFDQLVRDYGTDNARVIRNSCGNLFTGITSLESAEMISRMMGDYEEIHHSKTSSDSGQSVTRSLRDRKVIKASEVAGQGTGHFSGRILGAQPPFFSAQFKHVEYPAEDIPRFNVPVRLGDPKTEELILKEIVKENYEQIRKEVKELIEGY